MAYVGLRHIIMAPWTKDNTYGEKFGFGKAIGLQINPSYAEGSLFADDKQAEYDKEFSYADVTLNTNTIPVTAHTEMFGHTKESNSEEITYKAGDQSAYVGMAWMSVEKVDGVRKFIGNFICKVKFSEPSEDYATKGESIEYKTPSISGRAIAQDDGKWKIVEKFDTEEAAMEWINEKFGSETQAA